MKRISLKNGSVINVNEDIEKMFHVIRDVITSHNAHDIKAPMFVKFRSADAFKDYAIININEIISID